jgi:hypothetical protein
MEDLLEALFYCERLALAARGFLFTWNNGQEGPCFVQERLEKVVTSSEWCTLFPAVDVVVEASVTSSDHALLFLALKGNPSGKRPKRTFKYEASWSLDGECKGIIQRVWRAKQHQGSEWFKLTCKLDHCNGQLSKWSRDKHGFLAEEIKNKSAKIAELQQEEGLPEFEILKQLQQDVHSLLAQEELH